MDGLWEEPKYVNLQKPPFDVGFMVRYRNVDGAVERTRLKVRGRVGEVIKISPPSDLLPAEDES